MRKRLLFLVMITGFGKGYAQQFGGNPPSLRWHQINTDTVRVIFPDGLASQARQVARTVTYLSAHNRRSIGSRELKTNIVLQNRTVTANGFVSLSPFRAVFQVTPPSDNFSLGSLNWVSLLSLHEYRHALQNMNFRSGIGRTFYDLFGENGQAVVTNALIPDWFWEGDAVFMETALSDQGRGRLPGFLEPFKGLAYADKHYAFAKIRNGSYRDLVPNLYPLGYMMTAYGRDTLGNYLWEMATQQALLNRRLITTLNKRYPERPYHSLRYGIYPLSSALHYLSGTKIPGFYQRSLAYFARRWDSARSEMRVTPVAVVRGNPSRSVLNYRYPHPVGDGSVLAVKYGYAYTPRIVRIDTSGNTSLVVHMGNTGDDYFSAGGGKIAWTEVRPNARWGWTDYSVLRVYDTLSRRTHTLSVRSRYFSPAVSPDGRRIAVVEMTGSEASRLVILDAASGAVEKRLPNPEHFGYTYPVFTPDGNALVAAVRDSLGRMAWIRQPLRGGPPRMLSDFFLRTFGPPALQGPYVYFPAGFGATVQLYALDTRTGTLWSIADRPLGDYSVGIDTAGRRLVFDEYSAKGYFLASVPLDTASWTPLDTTGLLAPSPSPVVEALRAEGGPVTGRIPRGDFSITPYKRGAHLINIHSWSFLPTYPEVGLYLQSQDILNTLTWTAGGGYNVNENSPYLSGSLAYAGWFPIVYANYKRTFHRTGYLSGQKLIWNESDASVGFGIPLSLSSNRYGRSLVLGGFLHRNALNFQPSSALKNTFTRVTYLDGTLSFSNGLLHAVQQLYPRFGQSVSVDYARAVGKAFAQQLTVAGDLFLPGLLRNHSFYLSGAYAVKDVRRQYKFSDHFSYAGGYDAVPYREIYNLGANYQLPLAYPDWGTTWAYLLRIRLHGFFNYSHAAMLPGVSPREATYRSVGGTLYFDCRFFTALSISWGIRYSYLLDHDFGDPGRKGQLQLVVPLTIF